MTRNIIDALVLLGLLSVVFVNPRAKSSEGSGE